MLRTALGLLAIPLLLATSLVVTWMPVPARAAEGYDNCTGFIDTLPATIGREGTWCLRKDLSTSMISGSAITVAADDVIIDCNDFKLGGLGAGPDSRAVGVALSLSASDMTVRNCGIRGFPTAIETGYISGSRSGAILIENNRVEKGVLDIAVLRGEAVIRNNIVRDSPGTTAAITYEANGGGGSITGNTISRSGRYGIFTMDADGTEIRGNRITATSTGDLYQIELHASFNMVIEDNILTNVNPGAENRPLYCENRAFVTNNVFIGFGQFPTASDCSDLKANSINPN